MKIKRKTIVFLTLLLVVLTIAIALGMKFFPFSRLIKMPTGSQEALVSVKNPAASAPNSWYYDFEIEEEKDTPSGFYKGIANSGQYSVKAFGQNSFSFNVEKTVASIGLQNMEAVALSAWIYVFPTDNEVKGSLVFSASNDLGVNICWRGVSLVEPEIPRGAWFKISGYFDLKGIDFKPESKIQFYFWNNSRTDILIDDYYMVFGGAVDRRGDSALVDLTRPEGYVRKLNMPPFPVDYLLRLNDGLPLAADALLPGDLTVSGNFFESGTDALMVIRGGKPDKVYLACKTTSRMEGHGFANSGILPAGIISAHSGNFASHPEQQVLLVTDKKIVLVSLSGAKELCNPAGNVSGRILAEKEISDDRIFTGRFTGGARSEVLIIDPSGDWKVLAVTPMQDQRYTWKTIASGDKNPVSLFNTEHFYAGITPGKFIAAPSGDQLLVVARSAKESTIVYDLLRLNPGKSAWVSLMKGSNGGLTTGIDTLKPEDRFFILPGLKGSATRILRYNRDWRFDLKEITFNDTSFTIQSNIDFQGYQADQNPKYYESLNLVHGRFLENQPSLLLVSGKNLPERNPDNILPGFNHFYSFRPNQK